MRKLSRKERTKLIIRIGDLLEISCKRCVYKDQINLPYCHSQCAVGAELKRLGEYLERGELNMAKISKETYEALKKEGKSDVFIASYFGIHNSTLAYHKKKWYGEQPAKQEEATEEIPSPASYEELMEELKNKLSEKDSMIDTLKQRIEALEKETKEKQHLHAACEDIENELLAAEHRIKQLEGEKAHTAREMCELKNEVLRLTNELEEAERENEQLSNQNVKLRKLLEVAIEM